MLQDPVITELRGIRLLVIDPELGDRLQPADFGLAQEQVVLPTLDLGVGHFDLTCLEDAPGVQGEVWGFIVTRGALATTLRLAGRDCVRAIGQGALTLLDGGTSDDLFPVDVSWSAIAPSRLAIFDRRMTNMIARWPPLLQGLLRRAAQQPREASIHHAISQLPRVEDRLLTLMWKIADRHGVVTSDGVFLGLRLTHRTLADMIGAQRSTVSLGLSHLARAGVLHSRPDGWLLNPDSLEAIESAGLRRTT